MPTATQPLDLLAVQRLLPTELRSTELGRLDQWTRERAFYMATVTRTEILQEMRGMVREAAEGEAGEYELRKRWEEFLDGIGYEPEPGQEGTIKDLRSLRRFNVALRTNLRLMRGWAMKENGLSRGEILSSPGWELVRIRGAEVPRDWQARFARAGGEFWGDTGRMIAPKLSEVWAALGSIELFDDALGVDYPPFAWGSGKSVRPVGAREMVRLGIMTLDEIRAQAAEAEGRPAASPNASLESRPAVEDEDLRERIAEDLGGLARWDDAAPGTLIFTDPNGTRPVDDAGLESIWSTPLPEHLGSEAHPEGLLQRDSVLSFADDPERFSRRTDRDAWEDLARAILRTGGPDASRRAMRGIFGRGAAIGRLTSSPIWRDALALGDAAARAVGIVRAIRSIF